MSSSINTREDAERIIKEMTTKVDSDNMSNLIQIKTSLNKIFGPQYNQIEHIDYKPLLDSIVFPVSESNLVQQLSVYFSAQNFYQIIIHFPEIVIRNSLGLSRLLRDIYVKMTFDTNLKCGGSLFGVRATYTAEEYVSSYNHSHLSGYPAEGFSTFCLGSGPLSNLLRDLRRGFDANKFELMCMNIKPYLSWESIEGTPYKYIGRIASRENISEINDNTLLAQLYSQLIKDGAFTEHLRNCLLFSITERGVKIKPKEEFEIKLAELISEFHSIDGVEKALVLKRANGEYAPVIAMDEPKWEPGYILTFKGQRIHLNVIKEEDERQIKQKVQYAHPTVTKYIIRRLSADLTLRIKSAEEGGHEGQSNNNPPVTEPNLLAV